MTRKCRVGESPTVWLIEYAHDAARSSQGEPGHPNGYYNGDTRFDGSGVRKDLDPWDLMTLPGLETS